jgi:hypothetical protein
MLNLFQHLKILVYERFRKAALRHPVQRDKFGMTFRFFVFR